MTISHPAFRGMRFINWLRDLSKAGKYCNAGTTRGDAGHWRFPVRWLIAANSCRPKQPPQWRIGLARFAAAPQAFFKDESNLEHWEVCWPAATADRARPDCTTLNTCTHLFGSFYFFTVTAAFIFCFSRLMHLSPWFPQSREPFAPFLVNIL